MWYKPQTTGPINSQTGQAKPGAGAAYTPVSGPAAEALLTQAAGALPSYATGPYGTSAVAPEVDPTGTPRGPVRPTKGKRTWLSPTSPAGLARGGPAPENAGQARPTRGAGAMNNVPPVFGGNIAVETPYYSRGSAAYVQNYGRPLVNPIGAGIQALNRPQASYGPSGQYIEGEIFWTSQVIPTSINLQSLTDPAELAALLDPLTVYAVARVNG